MNFANKIRTKISDIIRPNVEAQELELDGTIETKFLSIIEKLQLNINNIQEELSNAKKDLDNIKNEYSTFKIKEEEILEKEEIVKKRKLKRKLKLKTFAQIIKDLDIAIKNSTALCELRKERSIKLEHEMGRKDLATEIKQKIEDEYYEDVHYFLSQMNAEKIILERTTTSIRDLNLKKMNEGKIELYKELIDKVSF